MSGPVFRFTPHSLSFNSPTAVKTIYSSKTNVAKAEYYKTFPRDVGHVSTWNCIDKRLHARKRGVLNNAFSDRALRSAEPFIQSNFDRWAELLNEKMEGGDWSGSLK